MRKFRLFIDIAMYLILIALMGYHITENLIHEILGTLLTILFIIHLVLNIKWYKTIFKGKYNFRRIFQTIINLSLGIFLIGTILSGILMSQSIYKFINVDGASLFRTIHKLFNSWLLLIMSIHVGLHFTGLINKMKKKLKDCFLEYVIYLLIFIFIGFGIYCFFSEKMYEDMFMMSSFKMFNYEESIVWFYFKYIAISLSIAISTNILLRIGGRKK